MKNIIYFPSFYKRVLLNKTKTYTIRTDNEIGKYREGKTYGVYSYGETDWKLRIRIDKVYKVSVNELTRLGIPERSIKSLIKKTNLSLEDRVELIHFSYFE